MYWCPTHVNRQNSILYFQSTVHTTYFLLHTNLFLYSHEYECYRARFCAFYNEYSQNRSWRHRDSNLLCLLAFRLFQMAQAWIRQAPAGALLYELLQLPGAFLCFLQTYLLNQVLTAAWKIRSVCKIFLLLNVYLDISVFLIWSGIFIQNTCSCSNYSLL